jgi:hypothetical protein
LALKIVTATNTPAVSLELHIRLREEGILKNEDAPLILMLETAYHPHHHPILLGKTPIVSVDTGLTLRFAVQLQVVASVSHQPFSIYVDGALGGYHIHVNF